MSAIIEVNVSTNSDCFKVFRKDGNIKIHLKSPPENNRANLELIKELSQILGCSVHIISGQTSRRKKLRISCSLEDFDHKIQITLKA